MDRLLDGLYSKRASEKEHALSSIIEGLTANYRSDFAEKNFATLLYRCLNSFKKGSSKEIVLASRTLGLLAITIGCGDNAQELYKESLAQIPKALKSKNELVLISVLNCLAIITFVGANGFEQTEAAMEMIWNFANPNLGENVAVNKHPSSVLSAAISAWSLLLTTFDGWSINYKYWKSAVSFYLDLLKDKDESVCLASIEALSLICEIDGNNISYTDFSLQSIQGTVQESAKQLSMITICQSEAMKALDEWGNFSTVILEILEDGFYYDTVLKIGRHKLEIHALSQLLQVNFVKRFLGHGFVQHMVVNDFLRDVFNFTPSKRIQDDGLYIAEREEAVVHLYVDKSSSHGADKNGSERIRGPANSAFRKAKTQLLNQYRVLKGEESQSQHD